MHFLNSNRPFELGFSQAKQITKEYAKTFYFASRFLPKEKRLAAYSIYAICRISDESVDSNRQTAQINLAKITQRINHAYANENGSLDNLTLSFKKTINEYKIPKLYFDQLIEGMRMDINKKCYENFDELYSYCYRVAGVVGLIMLKIFGYANPLAEKYAIDLGIAMQLTNIIRDIKEDYRRKRIYLPQDEMNKYGISEKHIEQEKIDNNFSRFIDFQISRARQYYKEAQAGIKLINGVKSRFVVLLMKGVYSKILSVVENNNYNVFSKRSYVNTAEKIFTLFKILFKFQYLRKTNK